MDYRWYHYLDQIRSIKFDTQTSYEPFELAQKMFVDDCFTKMFKELS